MSVQKALKQLREAEIDFADELVTVGQRHAAEHDVYHACRTLSTRCHEHADRIAAEAQRLGFDVAGGSDHPSDEWQGFMAMLRQKMSAMSGRVEQSGRLLLRDLRRLYLQAEEVSFLWTQLGQVAQAMRDQRLLDMVTSAHKESITAGKWVVTKMKETAPVVLLAG